MQRVRAADIWRKAATSAVSQPGSTIIFIQLIVVVLYLLVLLLFLLKRRRQCCLHCVRINRWSGQWRRVNQRRRLFYIQHRCIHRTRRRNNDEPSTMSYGAYVDMMIGVFGGAAVSFPFVLIAAVWCQNRFGSRSFGSMFRQSDAEVERVSWDERLRRSLTTV